MRVRSLVGIPWARSLGALVLSSWVEGFSAPPTASAEDAPIAPPLCAATFGNSGGDDADHDLASNSALARAEGGAAQENSSDAQIGVAFVAPASLTATVQMGVTYSGILRGSLGTNTIFGTVRITARLHDATAGVDLGSQVLLDKKQDGAAFEAIIEVVASNPFDPPLASFEGVELIANHQYTVTLEVVATAKGLGGRSDFKDDGHFVRFGCVAVVASLQDSDGDGLYDLWEENGIDADLDGVVDVDLPGFGATSDHKDLFVEMDWRPGQEPSRADIQALKAAFALAPVDAGGTANPDGQPGINLWFDTGNLMEDGMLVGDDLGGGGDELPDPVICLDASFYEAKSQYFDRDRLLAFRWVVSGMSPEENDCADGTVPAGRAELGGNDLIVYGTQAGLIFHELGHTLDLGHGGFEGLNNKPNYVSMMNYNYGFSIPQISGGGLIDFAPPLCAACPGGRGAIPADLDETQLDETVVLDPNDAENVFQFRDVFAITTGSPMSGQDSDNDGAPDIDWSGDGAISNAPGPVDINEDGKCVAPGSDGVADSTPAADDVLLSDSIIHDGPNRQCDTAKAAMSDDDQVRSVGAGQPDILAAYDDWRNIVLSPRAFGDDADGPTSVVLERTLAEILAVDEEINTTDLEISKTDLPDPVNAGAPLTYRLTVENHGPQPARGIRVVDVLPAEASYVSDTGDCVEAPPGTLTCPMATLLVGQSRFFEVTVVVEADAVADLPAPATVENSATVENKVAYGVDGNLGEIGADPDPTNDSDTEETIINRPPVSDPNGPYVEECQGVVTAVPLDGTASFDPDGDPITFAWESDCPGALLDDASSATPTLTVDSPPPCPVACEAALTVTDPMGLSDSASASVTIQDTIAPTITVQLTPDELWPPNHKLVSISATVQATDLCDPSPSIVLTSITSDEPDDAAGNGDGNTVGDIQGAAFGTADFAFRLRAERAGAGDGRVYTVTYTATDGCGLSTAASAEVIVPHH